MNTVAASSSTLYPNGGAVSLDGILTQIVTTQNHLTLSQNLRKFAPKEVRETILASSLAGGQDPLTVLDVERNTLGYLYILSARLHSSASPTPALEVIEEFCSRFDPAQARLAPDRVTYLAKGIVRLSESSNNLKFALGPLYNLVTRYPPSLSYLTTLHPIYLTICVSTAHFSGALPLLSVPITTIDTSLSDLSYNDNLTYHYAGGMVLGALKRWREAEEYFEICVSAPGQVPAAIQLEALKKLMLVQLILYGETLQPPKYTLPALPRFLKGTPYSTFIKAYPQQRSALRTLVSKDSEMFVNENNLGLIHQAIDHAPRWLIKKLTATYLTLGLADIAKEVGFESEDEVRATIISMIETDDISASISADGTVTFADAVTRFTKDEVDSMLAQAQEQSRVLLELERAMNVSSQYLTKAIKYKDDTIWGVDEEMFPAGSSLSGGGWAEESIFS